MRVFFRARSFANKHNIRVAIAFAKDDAVPLLAQSATATICNLPLDVLPA